MRLHAVLRVENFCQNVNCEQSLIAKLILCICNTSRGLNAMCHIEPPFLVYSNCICTVQPLSLLCSNCIHAEVVFLLSGNCNDGEAAFPVVQ